MTPQERLESIEHALVKQSMTYEQTKWLIARIEQLEFAAACVLEQFRFHGTSLDKLQRALTQDPLSEEK